MNRNMHEWREIIESYPDTTECWVELFMQLDSVFHKLNSIEEKLNK